MPVLITRSGAQAPRISSRRVSELASAMLVALNSGDLELSILLCDDRIISALNKRFRDQPRPTDVLAFPVDDPANAGGPKLIGDVAISLQTAAAQAKFRGVMLLDEVTFLLAHGLLHLLGMDHDTPRKAAAMNRRTVALLWAIGLKTPSGAIALAPAAQKKKGTRRKLRPHVRLTTAPRRK